MDTAFERHDAGCAGEVERLGGAEVERGGHARTRTQQFCAATSETSTGEREVMQNRSSKSDTAPGIPRRSLSPVLIRPKQA